MPIDVNLPENITVAITGNKEFTPDDDIVIYLNSSYPVGDLVVVLLGAQYSATSLDGRNTEFVANLSNPQIKGYYTLEIYYIPQTSSSQGTGLLLNRVNEPDVASNPQIDLEDYLFANTVNFNVVDTVTSSPTIIFI